MAESLEGLGGLFGAPQAEATEIRWGRDGLRLRIAEKATRSSLLADQVFVPVHHPSCIRPSIAGLAQGGAGQAYALAEAIEMGELPCKGESGARADCWEFRRSASQRDAVIEFGSASALPSLLLAS